MKTLIIFDEMIRDVRFAILDGDYSRFHGISINSREHECDEEFSNMVYDEQGNEKIEFSEDISIIEGKQWDKVAVCSFIP